MLERFVDAQDPVFEEVCAELACARKRTHWMWFVFPQLRGLGRSATARHFGIESHDEALAYWTHPVLGPRLKRCAELLLAAPPELCARDVLGSPDDLKLRSCATLFAQVAPEEPAFRALLERYYGGEPDPATLALLAAQR